MKHFIGYDDYSLKKKNEKVPVVMDTSRLINGHVIFTGMTGSGKSHQLIRMLQSAVKNGVEIDIFDVHEELDIPGSTPVKISEYSQYGYNPLKLNTDLHSGGVRKKINDFVRLINSSSTKLGPRQEGVLRSLLEDLYLINGCTQDPNTWLKRDITSDLRDRIIAEGNYNELRAYYPTIDDLVALADRKLKSLYIGSDEEAYRLLERVNAAAKKIEGWRKSISHNHLSDSEQESIQNKLDSFKSDAIERYEQYVTSIRTGRELDDIIKYNSKDTLQSVIERINILNSSGIFRPNPPPFGNSRVRCHQIKSLSDDEQRLYAFNRMEEIFQQRIDNGKVDDVEHIIVIDEASRFTDDDPSSIANRISNEARKFGLALWCSSPNFNHFSEDFIVACGTTVITHLHTNFWDVAIRKLRMDKTILEWTRPREVIAVKTQIAGFGNCKFKHVNVID